MPIVKTIMLRFDLLFEEEISQARLYAKQPSSDVGRRKPRKFLGDAWKSTYSNTTFTQCDFR